MNSLMSRITAWCSRSIVLSVLFASTAASAQEVYVCVWRNPERTMTRLFPGARDYRTVTVAIAAETLARIEKRTGSALLPGQREQYQYFEMIGTNGTIIGHTHAMTQKGEFGAIEFVFGTDPHHRITGIYIQRQRERDRAFREESFLEKFRGLAIEGAEAFADPLGTNGCAGSRAMTLGVREALIEFDELVRKKK